MPPPLAITATAALRSAADVEQTARQVREALGSSAVVEQDDGAVLVARCGSPTAHRLLGAWAKSSQVPMRARFDQLVADLERTGLTTTGPVHEQ